MDLAAYKLDCRAAHHVPFASCGFLCVGVAERRPGFRIADACVLHNNLHHRCDARALSLHSCDSEWDKGHEDNSTPHRGGCQHRDSREADC